MQGGLGWVMNSMGGVGWGGVCHVRVKWGPPFGRHAALWLFHLICQLFANYFVIFLERLHSPNFEFKSVNNCNPD